MTYHPTRLLRDSRTTDSPAGAKPAEALFRLAPRPAACALVTALVFLGGSLGAAARAYAQTPAADQILPGEQLPNDKAETINGKSLDFPAVMRGAVATCVFGFGKDASDRVGVWLESLTSDEINAWSVVNLESVPSVARGALRVAMHKGTPKELLERSLVISKDSVEWKRILGVQREALPVVALFDKSGTIVWKRQGTFSSSIADELKAKIAELTGK